MTNYVIIEIPDDRGSINTTWGKALGFSSCSFICHTCKTIWRANFPRQQMVGVKDSSYIDNNPCPSCVNVKVKKMDCSGNE